MGSTKWGGSIPTTLAKRRISILLCARPRPFYSGNLERGFKFFHLIIALGQILGQCLRNNKKTLMSKKVRFRGKAFPRQTCANQLRDVNLWERTPWHWSKHVKFRPSWGYLFPPFIGTIASVVLASSFIWKYALGWLWANLGWRLRNQRKTLMSPKACFRGKVFLGIPAKITFVEKKDVNSWNKFRP